MSGGYFDYSQYQIKDIANSISESINNDWVINEYSDQTINEFKNGVELLNKAYIYAQRIDWLLSGDDGEESFHERLNDELGKLNETPKNS